MYVKVLHGANQQMLCNTSCAVVNLLESIRRRAGLMEPRDQLELSDETGLVKELNGHNGELAEKFLCSDGTYVLLRKLERRDPADLTDGYAPLLENYAKLLPGYQVHVKSAQVISRGTSKVRGQKSPTQSSKPSKMAVSTTATSSSVSGGAGAGTGTGAGGTLATTNTTRDGTSSVAGVKTKAGASVSRAPGKRK